MTSSPFAGHVFVVAGSAPLFGAVADALTSAGAAVALVGRTVTMGEPAAHFRADPDDAKVWARVIPHVEQRLGPIDAVVTDERGRLIAEELVVPDLVRRGHGAVVTIDSTADIDAVLSKLADTL